MTFPLFADSNPQVKLLVDDAYKGRLFGSATLVFGDSDRTLSHYSAGESHLQKIYDLASLTKVVATTTSIMILEERGSLALSDKVSRYFPDFKGGEKDFVTVEDLLRHRAGLPPGAALQENESFSNYLRRISRAPLSYRPRTQTIYSDLSFLLLGRIAEMVSKVSLAEFAQSNIFKPLKMSSTNYQVGTRNFTGCAPTSSLANCRVHDPMAQRLLPLTVGNAGLFSTATDLARFCQMILGNGVLEGVRVLSETSVSKMVTTDGQRGLGWDLTSEYATAPRGDVFPAGISFGHTGYTGTTIWIDPTTTSFYVFLSNRVYMGDERTRKPFTEFRKNLGTEIGKFIYGPSVTQENFE